MISPLIVPALAAGLTLCYASVLDIRERRVPFRTWYPLFLIVVPFSIIFYGFYLLRLELSQFINFVLIITVITLGFIALDYGYTSLKYHEKPKNENIINASSCWLLFSVPPSSTIYGYLTGNIEILLISSAAFFFCILIYFFGIFAFGGADYIALLLIGVGIPLFPFEPLTGYPVVIYFPWSVFLNAIILNIFTPIGILLFNRSHSNKAPLRYQFLGFPVKGEEIQNSFGFVMEVIDENEGVIQRRFLTFREILGSLFSRNQRIYTRDLRVYPEKYAKELEIYRKSGSIWISYGIPFIVPITLGLISAIFIGDFVFILMNLVVG